jgi:hypothetical protein
MGAYDSFGCCRNQFRGTWPDERDGRPDDEFPIKNGVQALFDGAEYFRPTRARDTFHVVDGRGCGAVSATSSDHGRASSIHRARRHITGEVNSASERTSRLTQSFRTEPVFRLIATTMSVFLAQKRAPDFNS